MAESGISQVIQSEAVVNEHTGRDAYTPFGVTWLCDDFTVKPSQVLCLGYGTSVGTAIFVFCQWARRAQLTTQRNFQAMSGSFLATLLLLRVSSLGRFL